MSQLPSGTSTFLFTDVEGSTKIARKHPTICLPSWYDTMRYRTRVMVLSLHDSATAQAFSNIALAMYWQ
jgi:hypothetical protein